MPTIRIMAAASAIITTLSFAASSASACEPGQSECETSVQPQTKHSGSPLRLNQFLKRPGQSKGATPAAKPSSAAQPKTAKTRARVAAKPAAPAATGTEYSVPAAPSIVSEAAPEPSAPRETTGVSITSADEVNEIDAAADTVQIVAANELNEIDLAADSPSTTGQASAASVDLAQPSVEAAQPTPQPAADLSWIGKLLAAIGGIVAAGSAARLLIA
jgi:hypothetical protein